MFFAFYSEMKLTEPLRVIYQSAEDGLADTIKPRLEQAGADCEKISVIDESDVYHELFDEALARYNEKQTRNDRLIDDYYEKICSGRQENPFHEIILQIGNKDDMGAKTEAGQLAAKILDKYMQDFQQRNPTLRVFSAYLHMDGATPHLHIDFIPYTMSQQELNKMVQSKEVMVRLCVKIVAETDLYETDKEVQNLIDWVCLLEQIKENNNTIRNLAVEYKKIEPDCREGMRAQLERMKKLCKERNRLYEKQNDLKGQKWKIEKSLER